MKTNVNSRKSRNTLLEILRLCASLWVLYYHGISLISRSEMFGNGRIAVDFFFILSGFFLISSLSNSEKFSFKGLFSFLWKRFKPLSLTFGICMIFSIIYYIQFFEGFWNSSIWGYLWYIPHLMLVFGVFFIISKLCKNRLVFNVVVGVISTVCYALVLSFVTDYGIIRGIAGVGFGVLISQIPSIWKSRSGKIVSCVGAGVSFALIVLLAILHPSKHIQDPICLLVLFPAVIYFCAQIPFSNSDINWVCSLSFGLYAYQTVARVVEANMLITNPAMLFLLVVILAIADKVLISYVCAKRKARLQEMQQKEV